MQYVIQAMFAAMSSFILLSAINETLENGLSPPAFGLFLISGVSFFIYYLLNQRRNGFFCCDSLYFLFSSALFFGHIANHIYFGSLSLSHGFHIAICMIFFAGYRQCSLITKIRQKARKSVSRNGNNLVIHSAFPESRTDIKIADIASISINDGNLVVAENRSSVHDFMVTCSKEELLSRLSLILTSDEQDSIELNLSALNETPA
ncbi:hypothetical protein CS022_13315 [Veronia nyctiphanis]|uniref:Uncharacterized protein n=1 Tax=Veronia nyctiphanis TaxID=1278244 RepID=A0A4Q0YV05_9GAMM|nr:hypothetical protein [Veronia nyctiphanis]RXJ72831.1 hypothetical protein CS022_13315 [Veronia nyctiphanis]